MLNVSGKRSKFIRYLIKNDLFDEIEKIKVRILKFFFIFSQKLLTIRLIPVILIHVAETG
jgi:hypothetical protein